MQGARFIQVTFFLLMSLLVYTPSLMAKTIYLRSISTDNAKNYYHVILHLSQPTHYRTFILQNPNRFVVDLCDAKHRRPLRLNLSRQRILANFRYAAHSSNIFRMVFGLHTAVHAAVRITGNDLDIVFRKSASSMRLQKPIAIVARKSSLPVPKNFSTQEKKTIITETDAENSNQPRRNVVIVIDPGHGGKDPGATGIAGTHEKNVVLAISKILQKRINQQPGFTAVLTRTADYYLTLRQRLAIARQDKADMFVAIHADMFRNRKARGVSVFALSQRGATSEAARWLAARENASELMGGVDLHDKSHLLKSVLINLSQSATIRASLEIGNDVISAVQPIARLHHNLVEQAAFVVLKSPDIPSLLIETGFLSNQHEERNLTSVGYQKQLASAIMHGIRRYFDAYPPRGTWLSYWKQNLRKAYG